MLTSEFQNELGALIRQLQQRIAEEPALQNAAVSRPAEWETEFEVPLPVKDDIDRAIIRLVALRLSLG